MDLVSSVRVEVEENPTSSAPMPDMPETPGLGRSMAVGIGLVVLLVVMAAIVVLRPSDGETADGTQRGAPTATTTTTTVPTTSLPAGVVPYGSAEPLGFEPQSDGIVRTAEGTFLGLAWRGSNNLPGLFGSVDGTTWTRLEVSQTSARKGALPQR